MFVLYIVHDNVQANAKNLQFIQTFRFTFRLIFGIIKTKFDGKVFSVLELKTHWEISGIHVGQILVRKIHLKQSKCFEKM